MPIIAVNHLEVAYTGKEAHASAYPYLGDQRRRRPGRRPDGDRPAPPAPAPERPRPRDRHQGRRRRQHHPGPHDRRLDGPGRRPGAAGGGPGQGGPLLRGRRPGHRGDPGAVRGPRALLRDAPRPRAVGPVPAQRRGPRAQLHRHERPRRRVDRHGQRLPGPALDPPDHRHRLPCPRSTTSPSSPPSCATPAADQAVVDGAVAMAWTAIDAATDQTLRERLLAGPATAAGCPGPAGGSDVSGERHRGGAGREERP